MIHVNESYNTDHTEHVHNIDIVMMTVVVRALVCAGAVVGTFVEVLTVDMRVGVVIIVSNVTVDLLADIMIGVLTNVGVDALLYVNANVFTDVMTAFGFDML